MLQHQGPVSGIVAGVCLLQLANTIFAVILPLQLVAAGFAGTAAGLVASAYGMGFLAGCLGTHRLIRSVGHVRAFAVLAGACAILAMIFAHTHAIAAWFALRLVMGFCQAGLFAIVEGWLSAATAPQARGGVLAFYVVATKVAIVAAQLLLGQAAAPGLGWIEVAGGVFVAALIPVALIRTPEPPLPRPELLGLRTLFRVAPAAMVGCAASGMLTSAVIGLTPVFGVRLGLATPLIVWLLTAIQLGSLALQWPLGRLSDRTDRRRVIVGCASAVALLSLLVPLADGRPALLLALFFLWGSAALTFYAVCVAHAADQAQPDQMVGVSSGALLAWSMGSALGPSVAAACLDLLGPAGLFVYAAVVALGLAVFVLGRTTRRSSPPRRAREDFADGRLPERARA